ncbi:MAG: hypothetical protein V5A64_07055 [Candidatus Thermoplasmatota archaeon]
MKKEKGKEEYPSLYDAFELGDRVKRVYRDENGTAREYKGIILAIYDNGVEVYWDTEDGKYRPEGMDVAFTSCSVEEIFKGDDHFSPLKRE